MKIIFVVLTALRQHDVFIFSYFFVAKSIQYSSSYPHDFHERYARFWFLKCFKNFRNDFYCRQKISSIRSVYHCVDTIKSTLHGRIVTFKRAVKHYVVVFLLFFSFVWADFFFGKWSAHYVSWRIAGGTICPFPVALRMLGPFRHLSALHSPQSLRLAGRRGLGYSASYCPDFGRIVPLIPSLSSWPWAEPLPRRGVRVEVSRARPKAVSEAKILSSQS